LLHNRNVYVLQPRLGVERFPVIVVHRVRTPVAIPRYFSTDGQYIDVDERQVAVVRTIAKDVGCAELHERDAGAENDGRESGQRPLHSTADAVAIAEVVAHD